MSKFEQYLEILSEAERGFPKQTDKWIVFQEYADPREDKVKGSYNSLEEAKAAKKEFTKKLNAEKKEGTAKYPRTKYFIMPPKNPDITSNELGKGKQAKSDALLKKTFIPRIEFDRKID